MYDGIVDRLAVDGDRLVRHQLARLGAGRAEAHAVHHVVQAGLEDEQQVGAGVATAAVGFGEVLAELALQDAVHPLDLLLLAQLQAVIGRALAGSAAVLAGLGVELGLVRDRATGALEEQVRAFTA
jgi:hypothetical protein